MPNNDLPTFIQALLKPEVYPHKAQEVKLVQTHISFVLLAGDFVYKIKKPVDFGFLDFTSLDKRQHFCAEELQLNRRLCPDLYIETLTINEQDGVYSFNGPGAVIEHCLKMHRMPEDKMMVNIIAARQLRQENLTDIVDILVPFYKQADGGPDIQKFGTSEAVAVNVIENFEQTAGFIGCEALNKEQFETISSYAKKFLKQTDLFQQRISAGKIRDCHGDLYSANICLADTTYIYDCIEFNERFRYCDVASDVAFLAMDLDFHDLRDFSDYVINEFITKSADTGLQTMLNFYKCYRAYVRGKIGLFTAHAPEVDADTKAKSLEQAKKYFLLAERYATEN
jgi:aminoglycoside phosphotransferase family enzyme